jgi:PAS domain-containing protein
MKAAQMGTWEWNITHNTAKWSDETKRMFGRSPGDPEGTPEDFFALVHPEDRSLMEEAINRAHGAGYA